MSYVEYRRFSSCLTRVRRKLFCSLKGNLGTGKRLSVLSLYDESRLDNDLKPTFALVIGLVVDSARQLRKQTLATCLVEGVVGVLGVVGGGGVPVSNGPRVHCVGVAERVLLGGFVSGCRGQYLMARESTV